MEKAVKHFQPEGKKNIPQFTASASALFFLTFPHYSGVLFPWEKKTKESQGCAKTASCWKNSHSLIKVPTFAPFPGATQPGRHTPAISSYLGPIHSCLTSQSNVTTDKTHYISKMKISSFLPGNNSPKPERFNHKEILGFFFFFLSETVCILLS